MADTRAFPFVYHEGIFARFLNKSKSGPIKNIRMMFEKQFLDEVDTAIMLHLQKYVYLNAFLMRVLLNRQLEECKPEFCKSHLNKLEKLGFIVRFQFIYNDDKKIEHATPFVYCLSSSARKLFPVKYDLSFEDNIMDIDCVQRRLSFNQFHIMLEGQYGDTLDYSSYVFGKEYDGLYKLRCSGTPLIFYVFSIRSSNGWEKKYLEQLRSFNRHVVKGGFSFSGIIIVCEYEYQSLKAERARSGDKTLNDLDIYYICDYAAMAEGSILQHVIEVNPEKNFSSYDIIKINVDGSVKENVLGLDK